MVGVLNRDAHDNVKVIAIQAAVRNIRATGQPDGGIVAGRGNETRGMTTGRGHVGRMPFQADHARCRATGKIGLMQPGRMMIILRSSARSGQ